MVKIKYIRQHHKLKASHGDLVCTAGPYLGSSVLCLCSGRFLDNITSIDPTVYLEGSLALAACVCLNILFYFLYRPYCAS